GGLYRQANTECTRFVSAGTGDLVADAGQLFFVAVVSLVAVDGWKGSGTFSPTRNRPQHGAGRPGTRGRDLFLLSSHRQSYGCDRDHRAVHGSGLGAALHGGALLP